MDGSRAHLTAALLGVLATGPARADSNASGAGAAPASPVPAPVAPPVQFLGLDDDATLARLCGPPIVGMSFNHRGTTLKFKARFADGSRAALRPSQRSAAGYYRADVAAYRLSRAMRLGTVPPACIVTVPREQLAGAAHLGAAVLARLDDELRPEDADPVAASLTYWIADVRDARLQKSRRTWQPLLLQKRPLAPVPFALIVQAAEGSRLYAWDFLIDNWDRWSGGNTFRAGPGGPFVWLDNAGGFGRYTPKMRRDNEAQLRRVQRFSRRFITALRALDEPRLRAALAPADLSEDELTDLIARRKLLLAHVRKLSARYGELSVLAFD